MDAIQIYESDFGSSGQPGKPSAKLRRMTRRKLKKWLANALKQAWDKAAL